MSLAYSPDGKYLAANGGSAGPPSAGIALWDPVSGKQLGPPIEGLGRKFGVTFSPDSRYLVAEAKSQTIGFWDVQTREHVGSYGNPDHQLWCFQFSPVGDRLISASSDYGLKIWPWHAGRFQEVKTPQLEIRKDFVNGFSNRATFSSDGARLITGGEDHTVKVCDATSGQLLQTLSGHTDDVFAVAVSRDGRWLASGGADTTIRLWDAKSGEARYMLRGHMGVVNSLAFSPDSHLLASGSRDRSVKVWRMDRFGLGSEPPGR
jgi:WD40 repeat protein